MAFFHERYLKRPIAVFLKKKMVFVGGPRQVGKTSLCVRFLQPPSEKSTGYLNWDDPSDRKRIKTGEMPVNKKNLCFDEIHKFKNWRSLIKGLYDKKKYKHHFLVTGSARLDYYRRSGDSLLGRYRYLRLHPLSLNELSSFNKKTTASLMRLGGFPEPFFEGTETNLKLWHRERIYRIINDDIRELNQIRELNSLELLADALSDRVGSPLSVKNLADDLSVHHQTVQKWLAILDSIYYSYRILPYGAPRIRAVKKEQKLYLWDWGEVKSPSSRFENMMAGHLLKYCHFVEDVKGDKMELRFLRDTDKREVDFVVLKNKKPLFAVECKTGDKNLSPHISYFKARTSIPKFYQVHLKDKHIELDKKSLIIPFARFCRDHLTV